MKWLRMARDLWMIVGITLLMILVLDQILRQFADGREEQVVPGSSAPSRHQASAYAGHDWVDQYWSEHDASKRMRWESYAYWRREPYAGEFITIDASGHRQTVGSSSAPSRTLWMFGGSSVWGTGVGDADTVPSQLTRALADAGMDAVVRNFGESGYVSRQSLLTLIKALEHSEPPDYVIFLEGANDVFAALQAGEPGIPQNESHRRIEFRASDGLDNYLGLAPHLLEGVMSLLPRPARRADDSELAARIIAALRHNISLARDIGSRRGFQVLAYWQPTLFSKLQPDAYEHAVVSASLSAHRDLQLAADLAAAEHSTVRSLSQLLDAEAEGLFLDFVHLGPKGNRLIAERIAQDVTDVAHQTGEPASASPMVPDPATPQ